MSALLVVTGTSAANPLYNFFDYQKPQPPVGGDCAAIAAAIGPAATWYGEFAGNYYDNFTDNSEAFSARGCFKSEYACRVWQNQALTYTGRGGSLYMRCRQGVVGRY